MKTPGPVALFFWRHFARHLPARIQTSLGWRLFGGERTGRVVVRVEATDGHWIEYEVAGGDTVWFDMRRAVTRVEGTNPPEFLPGAISWAIRGRGTGVPVRRSSEA